MKLPFQQLQIKQEIKVLRNNLKKTLKHLKTTYTKTNNKFKRHPWFIVIGPLAAGKTSLLSKSELDLSTAQGEAVTAIVPTKHYDWRLAHNAVFLDVAGNSVDSEIQAAKSLVVWQGLIKLLRRYRWYKPIDGLLVVMNLHAFQSSSKAHQKAELAYLHSQIQTLAYVNKSLPVYIIFNQCDLLEGFSDFFADLSLEERRQAWGMEFSVDNDGKSTSDILEQQFNALLQRLNDRLLWRMHQEYNLEKRAKIREFPLQLESLRQPIIDIANELVWGEQIKLRGIYFTSSVDKGHSINYLLPSISKAFALEPSQKVIDNSYKPQEKAYFIHNLLKDIIIPAREKEPAKKQQFGWYSWNKAYLIGLIVFILGAVLSFSVYQHDVTAIENIKQLMAQSIYTQPKQDTLNYTLNKLNTAYRVKEELQQLAWYQSIGFPQLNVLKKQASITYEKLLNVHLKLELKKILETQIRQADNPNQLYTALKIYLMLGEPVHLNQETVQNWFSEKLQKNIATKSQHKQLATYIADLLNSSYTPIKLNQLIINNARETLNNIPVPQLVYLALQNQYDKAEQPLLTQTQHRLFEATPKIPKLYTMQSFATIYNKQIPNGCHTITKGNWVLGSNIKALSINTEQCTLAAKAIYINEYANAWNQLVQNLKIVKFSDLNQTADTLKTLATSDSPLMQLLTIIKTNTAPLAINLPEQTMHLPFNQLNKLTTNMTENALHTELITVSHYVEKIAKNSNQRLGAFQALVTAIQNPQQDPLTKLLIHAQQLPQPLQTWINDIAQNTSALLLSESRSYINQQWEEKIFPIYNRHLNNRYPLFQEAKEEIDLEYFAKFFAPKGTIDTFFKTYLKPFVDTNQTYWTWKKIHGETLGIPQDTLEMFIRAALIRKMYFPNRDNTPMVRFSLAPLELSEGIQAFLLTTPTEKMIFQPGATEMSHFTWPMDAIEMQFVDIHNQKQAARETGAWGLFKLLDKSILAPTSDAKRFELTFELNGSKAKYELIAQDIVNPFIPHMLSNFRCPEKL